MRRWLIYGRLPMRWFLLALLIDLGSLAVAGAVGAGAAFVAWRADHWWITLTALAVVVTLMLRRG